MQGEPEGFQNLFVRNNETGAYALVDPFPPVGVSHRSNGSKRVADLSRVVFEEGAQLTPEAPPVANPMAQGDYDLYEWAVGTV